MALVGHQAAKPLWNTGAKTAHLRGAVDDFIGNIGVKAMNMLGPWHHFFFCETREGVPNHILFFAQSAGQAHTAALEKLGPDGGVLSHITVLCQKAC